MRKMWSLWWIYTEILCLSVPLPGNIVVDRWLITMASRNSSAESLEDAGENIPIIISLLSFQLNNQHQPERVQIILRNKCHIFFFNSWISLSIVFQRLFFEFYPSDGERKLERWIFPDVFEKNIIKKSCNLKMNVRVCF